jgi:hypothetical protein
VPVGGVDTNYNHVSPRVGFAFDPFGDGKTVLSRRRGSFGTIGQYVELPQNFQPFAVRFINAFTHVTSMRICTRASRRLPESDDQARQLAFRRRIS